MTPRLRRLVAGCAAALALVSPAAGAQVLPAEPPETIGGALLGRVGSVVQPIADAPALPSGISAAGWLVADLDTGEVLAARHAHGRFAPASTLKTLTAVALIPELDREALYYARDDDVRVDGSKVGLVPGQPYTADTLFKAMLIVSGNDASNALASASGGLARALALMNQTAQRLQAADTVARNPSGLDAEGQLSSPYDLALITRAGMRMPDYRRYVGTLRSWVDAPGGKRFEIYNHNKLLTRYAGVTGGKTGYTVRARHTYVVTARHGARHLVVTLMRAETDYADATKLLDWGFAAAGRVAAVGTLVEPLAVPGEERVDAEHADRSREQAAATALNAAPASSTTGSGPPMLPAAGVLFLAAVVAVALRRRQVRRRRYGARSSMRMRLPVR